MALALDSDRWQQLNALFHEALDIEPAERPAFLDRACGSDTELRSELETLLSAATRSGDPIASAVQNAARETCLSGGASLLVPGSRFAHYQVVSLLGSGGMGQVYLAEDIRLKRKVALKTLIPELVGNTSALLRFEQEARASSALNHPNILTIHDVGQAENRHYITCEFIEGVNLREKLRAGPLSVSAAIDVAQQVAAGLSAAHSLGITHRDIKPENIIVRPDGLVKIVDFGIAKLTEKHASAVAVESGAAGLLSSSAASRTGALLIGTPRYMSPEQVRGLAADARSDVFSLGAVLYEMLTGKPPFDGDTDADIMAAILALEPRPLRQLAPAAPVGLVRIVSKALAKDYSQRHATAREFLDDLEPLQKSPHADILRLGRAALGRFTWLAAACLLVGLIVAVFLFRSRPIASPGPTTTLAILPFRNLKPDPATDFLGFSLADAVISRLSDTSQLIVRPSSYVDRYRNRSVNPDKVAAELDVDTLLTGTYLQEGDQLRISTQLIHVKPARILWQRTMDFSDEKLLSVQEEIARQILSGLELRLASSHRSVASSGNAIDPVAYEDYLRGVDLYGQNDFHSAVAMLERSAAHAPNYALTWTHLGRAYTTNASLAFGGREQYVRAQAAYQRAMRLDPTLIEPRVYMADLFTNTGRVEEALPLLRDALHANPNYAEAHWQLGYAYRFAGLLPESLAECQRARQLDPNVKLYSSAINSYLYLGRYQDFLASLPSADNAYILFYRGFAHYYLHHWDKAAANFQQSYQLDPTLLQAEIGAALNHALSRRYSEGLLLTHQTEAKVLERGLEDAEGIYKIAQAYAVLGDKESSLRMLDRSVQGGFFCYPYFQNDPLMSGLRRDPAFLRLMSQARARQERFRTLAVRLFPNGLPNDLASAQP